MYRLVKRKAVPTLDSWLGQGEAATGEMAFNHSGSRLGGKSWDLDPKSSHCRICTVNA